MDDPAKKAIAEISLITLKFTPMGNNGGKRPGAGRPKGAKTKKRRRDTLALLAQSQGITPLEYMLKVMRDEYESPEVRMDMAKAAAPYVHPKLSAVEQTNRPHDFSKLTDVELDELGRLLSKMENVPWPRIQNEDRRLRPTTP